MIKNKSSSVSISNRSSTSATKTNNSGRKSSNKPRKPTIDREIAKKLDTLDRQGLKYLKESLRASRIVDREKKQQFDELSLEVEEDITIEDDIERHLESPAKLVNEIEEEIPEVHEDDDQQELPPPVMEKSSRVRTTIKARPISAVQKESATAEKNYSVDLYNNKQQEYQPEKFVSPKGASSMQPAKFPSRASQPVIAMNPFKKPPLRAKQVRQLSNNRQADGELQVLLHRIEKLEQGQRAQLEVILERMQKGEIDKVEMSSDVIVLGRSSSKPDILQQLEPEPPLQNLQVTKPVRSAMQKTRQRANIIEEEIDDGGANKLINETCTSREDSVVTIMMHQNKKEPSSGQPASLTRPPGISNNRLAPLKVERTEPKEQETVMPKKDKKKAATLTIRILENWGHASLVGLNHVEVFDSRGRRIAISQQNIVNPNKKLTKLFTGKVFTTDENEMWWAPMTRETGVELELNCRQLIGAVRLWNYNKSLLDIDKGAKTIEIQIKGDRVWKGEVARGCGNELQDYSTFICIALESGIEVAPAQPPAQKSQPIAVPQASKQPLGQQAVPAGRKDNKPNWLESTLVATKMQDLRKEELKAQAMCRQDSASKRLKRGRESDESRQEETFSSKVNITKIEMKEELPKPSPQIFSKDSNKSDLPAAERILNLQKEAETVQRDVQNSLLSIKKNLNLEGDDIFTEMLANRKSISLVDRQQLQQQPQAPPSNFRKDPSKGRKLVEEPMPSKAQPAQPQKQQHPQRGMKIGESQSIVLEQEVSVPAESASKQSQKHLPTVSELNKASELDNLINELNDIIPKNQKVVIPELPAGQTLRFNILLTWGDPYFVGLAGLEMFDQQGRLIEVRPKQIVSKHNSSTPQTVDKLVNGVYLTTDSHNQWLSPFKKDSCVSIDFGRRQSLSMIRLWNYNQSRIHSSRGVRYLSIELDSQVIFQGEIRKSNGEQHNQESLCEYIVFTADSQLKKRICENDWLANMKKQETIEEQSLRDTLTLFRRPDTVAQKKSQGPVRRQSASLSINYEKRFVQEYETPVTPKGFTVKLVIRSTWGDRHFVGLNGLEIFDPQGNSLLAGNSKFKLKASPQSVNRLPGNERDVRTIDKLVNGQNETFNESDMWLAPWISDLERLENRTQNTIVVQFEKSIALGAINIYNYTKTPSRGVRELQILLDETLVFMGYVRIGPSRDDPQPIFKTTITFLREAEYLRRIQYYNYNEDTMEQEVSMVNQNKLVSSGQQQQYSALERPPTSVTGRLPSAF